MKKLFSLSGFTLFTALIISAIAAWYSVQGLATIFAGAVIPIIIMGSALELAKITTTVWLHRYWNNANFLIRTYLSIAVIILACITSMGIFGLLSKAHSEQSLSKGTNLVAITELDRQIEIERKTIDDASKVIAQLDQSVQALIDANRIRGSSGSIAVRKSQTQERDSLNQQIKKSNEKISELESLKLPLIKEKLDLEAEVGPIKYLAALIYGENSNTEILEKAVRVVIILIVAVFDPLALILILAATSSIKWEFENNKDNNLIEKIEPVLEDISQKQELVENEITESVSIDTTEIKIDDIKSEEIHAANEIVPETILPEIVDKEKNKNIQNKLVGENTNYVMYNGKLTNIDALKMLRSDLILNSDVAFSDKFIPNFGSELPSHPYEGEKFMFLTENQHEYLEYKNNKWSTIEKQKNLIYLKNKNYLKFISKKAKIDEDFKKSLIAEEIDEISSIENNS